MVVLNENIFLAAMELTYEQEKRLE